MSTLRELITPELERLKRLESAIHEAEISEKMQQSLTIRLALGQIAGTLPSYDPAHPLWPVVLNMVSKGMLHVSWEYGVIRVYLGDRVAPLCRKDVEDYQASEERKEQ